MLFYSTNFYNAVPCSYTLGTAFPKGNDHHISGCRAGRLYLYPDSIGGSVSVRLRKQQPQRGGKVCIKALFKILWDQPY